MSETTIENQCGGCGEVTEELVWWVKFAMWLCPDCDADEREDGDTDPFGEFDEFAEDDEIEIDLDVYHD